MPATPASDMPADTWINRLAPRAARPYLRLARFDRPIGIWLLLLPCWWSIAMASEVWPDPWLLLLFVIGAAAMRGAGCTFNDIVDQDFDAMVARTASRPLPAGEVTLVHAWAWLIALVLIGFTVLLQFNLVTVTLGAVSLGLIAAYPFMKRVTYWPQAFLGLTFNWGALLGWTAVQGTIGWPAVALYGAGVLWTLGYDTIYAHQDKEDDALIGVKSTALRLGLQTKPWLTVFYVGAVALIAVAGWLAGSGWPFAIGLVLVASHFAWQIAAVDIDDPRSCLAVFRSNRDAGLILFASIVADRAILGG